MKKIKLNPYVVVTATALFATALIPAGATNTAQAGDTSSTAGAWSGYQNGIDLSPSLKGDTLYGYNNGCMYADFSHTALVSEGSYWTGSKWDGKIIESTNSGTASGANSVYLNHWQSHFLNYDAAALGYFYKSGTTFNATNIVNTASRYTGSYSVTSSFTDNTQWYCSKLVSRSVYDNNGYHLGFYVWGSFITPGDVYYDNAVYVRNASVSYGYDGNGAYAKPSIAATSLVADSSAANTLSYKGVTVHAKSLDKETTKAIDERLAAEKKAGKASTAMEITVPTAKPGLTKHAQKLVQDGKATKDQVKAAWGLSDSDL
jgi:hypothetical protein